MLGTSSTSGVLQHHQCLCVCRVQGPSEEVKLSSPSEEERRAPEADTDTRQKVVDTHLIDLTHQADVDIYQADVDKHQADVDIHQADVDIHQADVDIHQADSESCLKSLDTSVITEREGKSDNTVESDSSAIVVGCLGKKRRLPGWLSMGSMDGKREEDARGSKKRAAKGGSVHMRLVCLVECIKPLVVLIRQDTSCG